ncbi:DHH family phosphoesterase [Clostridium fallax]|uniref:Cyclic-di-AMP phosphodiesterase n=1 Tax=Clostridium fallax TaxID=1533 RepID=A0A1M4X1I6_9CLOT|nr:DHH family phosphoesterase [Clostridium fallax]SHE87315.1 c-di-AMP phosphodiesterase, consists of a GGDEF-like and DHH domains [Clostridium fallax]SQB22551.1 DHH family protein [Clostridium fallax]
MKSLKNKNIILICFFIFILAVLFYIKNLIELSLIILFGVIILFSYKLIKINQANELNKKKAEEFSLEIDDIIEKNLLALMYPLAIIKRDGEIVWSNEKFKTVFKVQDDTAINIGTAVRGIALDKALKYQNGMIQRLRSRKRAYDIYVNTINFNNEQLSIVYFNDVTYLIEGTKESVMLIEVDNLNEVVKSIDENNGPLFIAEVERAINNYAQNLNAMIRKYDSTKYVLSVSDSNIEEEIAKKFDILDTIREINLGNKLEVTLSIGVGRGGDSPAENHAYAIKAKELALGRGGDQAVIKKGDKFSFFGGNTKELEKRTRVRARVVAHALKDLIYESSKVYIMGHRNPDLDCFGAAVGIASVSRQLGKQCNIILNKDTRAIEKYLIRVKNDDINSNLIISGDKARETIDEDTLLILLDVHSRGYVQDLSIVEMASNLVIIDHHRRSADYIEGALLSYIEVYASSTSELVTEMVQYMLEKPKLTQIEAEGLLAGICMDTKSFFFKTGVRTFEAASFLRRLGADTIDIKKFFSNDLESYVQKAEIIKSAEVKNNIAIATCPSYIDQTVMAAQAADELLNITNIQASFVLVQINNDIYISGRSLGDINVQVILEYLGGGGHMTIAGAKLENVDINNAKETLKEAISKYLEEGE